MMKDRVLVIPSPAEVFFAACERSMGGFTASSQASGRPAPGFAAAIAEAGRATVHHLRHGCGWSLLNSHVLAALLVDAALGWLSSGGHRPDSLAATLERVCREAGDLHGEEAEWRRVTEAVLEGAFPAPRTAEQST